MRNIFSLLGFSILFVLVFILTSDKVTSLAFNSTENVTNTGLLFTGSCCGGQTLYPAIESITFNPYNGILYYGGLNQNNDFITFGKYNFTSNTSISLNSTISGHIKPTGDSLRKILFGKEELIFYGGDSINSFGFFNQSSNTSTDLSQTLLPDASLTAVRAMAWNPSKEILYFSGLVQDAN